MTSTQQRTIRIGGASGFWGDWDLALPQLLAAGGLDYVVFDYLAEVTMSIMARARAADPTKGYATDFVSAAIKPNLARIASSGVKIIANAGGVNPQACADAVRRLVQAAGLTLKVAVVIGDDLMPGLAEFSDVRSMDDGAPMPSAEKIASANAYLGAFPIAVALQRGADIVITGRCVDSAPTLGACIHAFGWTKNDLDQLAGASLAGHLLECGTQSTGGNFTDWNNLDAQAEQLGYPIAEIRADGSCDITKPEGTGGAVTVGTVGEQMLYEIGDPMAYVVPDVVCDFSQVRLEQAGTDRVRVSGARGRPATDTYKVSLTWNDGWRGVCLYFFTGEDAARHARSFADASIRRARTKLQAMKLPDFDEVLIEVQGDESSYGAFAKNTSSREVTVKLGVRHQDARGANVLTTESVSLGLSAPPGLVMFLGARPKPAPVVRLFSLLVAKSRLTLHVDIDGERIDLGSEDGQPLKIDPSERRTPAPGRAEGGLVEVPLIELAWARSGDKGNHANIGVLPRRPEYAPWIWQALTEAVVAERFAHFLRGPVERFFMPGTGAMNLMLRNVLGGGGVASLRNDTQGKAYGQLLLQTPIAVPSTLLQRH
ncbi:MAG: DUF1446 domain-containing protein [Rubrivivax sp.]|nr:DUF1446 domain-containing protein [Rubrivivax sp.]